jgi:hypothetical protein
MDPLCGNRSHRKLANLPEKGTPDSMGHDGSSESGWSIAHRERKRIMRGIILSQPGLQPGGEERRTLWPRFRSLKLADLGRG